MNKIYIVIALLLATLGLHAKELDLNIVVGSLDPQASTSVTNYTPLLGEPFLVSFEVTYAGDNIPQYPSFSPKGLSVRGRAKVNNQISITRNGSVKKVIFHYSMMAERSGSVSLSNIKIAMNGQEHKFKNHSIKVIKTRPKPKNMFIMAIPSKDEIYQGEGFDVNYYLYVKRNYIYRLLEFRETKTPEFKNILKRDRLLRRNEPEEAVVYNGANYTRIRMFSARVFSENKEFVEIGSMSAEFKFQRGSFSRIQSKRLSSKKLKLRVNPLPVDTMPKNFTGLVGKHSFELNSSRSKFLVNEPIELSVTVKGDGALDNYQLSDIYIDPNLETFDTQSEIFVEDSKVNATKKYEFTYLARSGVSIPEREMSLSTFDPETNKYVEHKLLIPAIVVAGTASASRQTNQPEVRTDDIEPPKEVVNIEKLMSKVIAPKFEKTTRKSTYIRYGNYVLLVLSVVIWLIIWFSKAKVYSVNPKVTKIINQIKKQGIVYSDLHQLVLFLNEEKPLQSGSIIDLIDQSELDEESKKYFIDALNSSEKQIYHGSDVKVPDYVEKYFKNFIGVLKDGNNK